MIQEYLKEVEANGIDKSSDLFELISTWITHYYQWKEQREASELDKMTAQKDYWYNRCYQAELFIEESPCDPDITAEQIETFKLWQESKLNPPQQ